MATLLKSLGIENAFVLGHSMGGIIALRMAVDYPQVVKLLVVSDTPSECNRRAHDLWHQVAQMVEWEGMGALTKTVESRFSPEFVARHPEAVAQANLRLLSSDPVVYAAACRSVAALYQRPLTPLLGQIGSPTLVLEGEADALTPPEATLIIQQGIPGAVLRVFPGKGHSLYHEAPADYTAAVITFLTLYAGT